MIDLNSKSILKANDFSEVGITDGLVAWYPLNGDTRDYTENRSDGINYGATITKGLNQLAYSFDGENDYVKLPNELISVSKIRSEGLCLSCWVKLSNLTGQKSIINLQTSSGYSDSSTGGIKIDGATPKIVAYDDGISYKYVSGTTVLNVEQWYHLSGTYNSIDKYMRLYVNGIEEGTPLLISNYSRLITNVANSIGKRLETAYTNGLIQDVRIYNRALSEKEIKLMYELTKNKNTHFTKNNEVFIPGKFNEVN